MSAARLSPADADAAHARSCACGDRAGHEAEDGSDYSIPRDDEGGPMDCEGGSVYDECTNTDVTSTEDPFEADVNDNRQLRLLCPACREQIRLAI